MDVKHSIWDAFLETSKVVLRVAMWCGIAYAGFLGVQALAGGALASMFGAAGATAATTQLGWIGGAVLTVVNGIGNGLAAAIGANFTALSGAQAVGAVLATAITPAMLKGTEGIREAVAQTLTGSLRTDGAIAQAARGPVPIAEPEAATPAAGPVCPLARPVPTLLAGCPYGPCGAPSNTVQAEEAKFAGRLASRPMAQTIATA